MINKDIASYFEKASILYYKQNSSILSGIKVNGTKI